MKIADAKKLYQLGGRPIDKMAAVGLGYGEDWIAKLPDPKRLRDIKNQMPSNKQLRAIVGAGVLAFPDLYQQAKDELEKRAAWAKLHEVKMRVKYQRSSTWNKSGRAAELVSKE